MKIDSHILFLIVIIGVISAGIVGASVMSNDTSMKQEVFDGITVSVPADSEFVKAGDGVYKDANYGIKINTFKNNDSMIDFLKNTKKSKIIPIDDQPPQSVAFKKGDTVNILVTNGNEGISIGSKDGELTSKMANNIVFSNNHKSEKPAGIPFAKKPMVVDKDFNLVMLLVADVDTRIFNVDMLQNNLVVVADDYNEKLNEPVNIISGDDSGEDLGDVSDISNQEDLNDVLSDSDNATTTTSNDDSQNDQQQSGADDSNGNDDVAQATVVSSSSGPSSDSGNAAGGDDVNSNPSDSSDAQNPSTSTDSSSSGSQQQELSVDDCKQLVSQQLLMNHPELMIDSNYNQVTNGYVFSIVDTNNTIVGTVTVDALTKDVEPDEALKQVL